MTKTMVPAGPWVAFPSAERDRGFVKPLFSEGLWVILPESNVERLPICVVDYADDHHAPTRACAADVARMISAAPDLLSLAKQWVALDSEFHPDRHAADKRRLLDETRAAIAKATNS